MARNKDGSRLERILDVLEDPCWKTLKSNIDMPMLVVIGAQSSGKSSVLSSIACMPFPVSDVPQKVSLLDSSIGRLADVWQKLFVKDVEGLLLTIGDRKSVV